MRWKNPTLGQVRVRSWFAFLPVTIDNETRWLERVTVVQQYLPYGIDDDWRNEKFL